MKNDDHDFGEDGADEDATLRAMLEGTNEVKKEKTVKRQLKFELQRVTNESECYTAFEREPIKLKTEQLKCDTILTINGKLLYVNDVLFLTSGSVRLHTQSNKSEVNNKSLIMKCRQNLKQVQE